MIKATAHRRGDEEAEACDLVMCVPVTVPLYFADNIVAPCAWCERPIQYRPHVPKRPPKVCMECAALRIQPPH